MIRCSMDGRIQYNIYYGGIMIWDAAEYTT